MNKIYIVGSLIFYCVIWKTRAGLTGFPLRGNDVLARSLPPAKARERRYEAGVMLFLSFSPALNNAAHGAGG